MSICVNMLERCLASSSIYIYLCVYICICMCVYRSWGSLQLCVHVHACVYVYICKYLWNAEGKHLRKEMTWYMHLTHVYRVPCVIQSKYLRHEEYKCSSQTLFMTQIDRKKPFPPGGFPIYYVPRSRTHRKRTPLEEFVPGASRGVLFPRVLDQGT